MNLRKVHYISGLTLSLFIGVHLFNHFVSILSASKHVEVMEKLRPFYRNMFVEPMLLGVVLVQIISGIKLFRISRKAALSKFEKLHVWTGLYLALFLIIHVFAVLAGRFFLHLDTNFYFGVAGINIFPFNIFFIPYYVLAIMSFFGHIASIHNKRMKKVVFGLTPTIQGMLIIIGGFIVTILIFSGLTNNFKGVTIPIEYKLIGK